MSATNLDNKSEKNKILTYLSTLLLILISFFFAEGWIIAVVALLGPLRSFIVLSIFSILLSNTVLLILGIVSPPGFIRRFQQWSAEKQKTFNPLLLKLVDISKIIGILVSSIVIGALLTTLLIDVLGYKWPYNHLLSIVSSILFCSSWVLIYSGAIYAIKLL